MDDKQPTSHVDDLTLADAADDPPRRTTSPLDSDGLIRSRNEPTFRDEFVIPVGDDDDLAAYEKLQPPTGISPAVRRALTAEPIPLTVEQDPERPLTQFTMTELFWLMTFLAGGFAVMHYLPLDQVAGVLGLLALVGQGLLRFPPENRHIRLGASALLVMYACAAAVAFGQHIFFPNR